MYENIPEFAAPVNFNIDKVVGVPVLYQEKRGKEFEYKDDPFAKLWEKAKPISKTKPIFFKTVLLHKFVYGEQFINKYFGVGMQGMKNLYQLYLLPAPEIIVNFKNQFDYDWRLKEYESYYWKTKTIYPESMVYRKDVNALTTPDQRQSRLNCLRNRRRCFTGDRRMRRKDYRG